MLCPESKSGTHRQFPVLDMTLVGVQRDAKALLPVGGWTKTCNTPCIDQTTEAEHWQLALLEPGNVKQGVQGITKRCL